MVNYIISSEKVSYYLGLLSEGDSRTIIVGLRQLLFYIEGGHTLLPNDKKLIVDKLLSILFSNNDERVRQWCYMLGAFLYSDLLTNYCLNNFELETNKNQSWMLALLSNNLNDEKFLAVRKKAANYLSKDVINLSTYLFSKHQYEEVNSDYVQRLLDRNNDHLAELWLGWIASFPYQNQRKKKTLLLNKNQMSQLTSSEEDDVLKHIIAAYSRYSFFSVESLHFDVFDYNNMESEHKKWTLTTIWKDKEFVRKNKDYFIELMSNHHLFRVCDKRIREGLANGLASYDYDEDFVYSVLDWYSNETEDSVKHFLLSYMSKYQNNNDDYYEVISYALTSGSKHEKKLLYSQEEHRIPRPAYKSDWDDPTITPIYFNCVKEQVFMTNNNNVIIHGNSASVQTQQGCNDSKILQKTEWDTDKYQELLDKIYVYKSSFEKEFGDKANELLDALNEAQDALKAKNETIWNKSIKTIRDLAVGASGSLVAEGIIGLINKLFG